MTKVPQDSRVYDIGKSLHADLAIMYFYRKKTAGWYSSDLFYLNVYVFDINKGRRIQSKADERSYKRIVEQALKEVIRESET